MTVNDLIKGIAKDTQQKPKVVKAILGEFVARVKNIEVSDKLVIRNFLTITRIRKEGSQKQLSFNVANPGKVVEIPPHTKLVVKISPTTKTE